MGKVSHLVSGIMAQMSPTMILHPVSHILQDFSSSRHEKFSGFPNVDTGICVSYNITHNSIGQWESLVCYKQLPFVCELPTTTSGTAQS